MIFRLWKPQLGLWQQTRAESPVSLWNSKSSTRRDTPRSQKESQFVFMMESTDLMVKLST